MRPRLFRLLIAGVVLLSLVLTPASTAADDSLRPASIRYTQAFTELHETLPAYLQEREGVVGVAVIIPATGEAFLENGHATFELASIAKIITMLALLDQVRREGRDLTQDEANLLEAMITISDNDAADALWWQVGGAAGVTAFLHSIGVTDIEIDQDDFWGASTASPAAIGELLSLVLAGRVLDADQRILALHLMMNTYPTQRWGVTAGLTDDPEGGDAVAVKDGWLPTDDGWTVNSVGMILPGDGTDPYTLVIMTAEQPDLPYAVETIEGVGGLVNRTLAYAP